MYAVDDREFHEVLLLLRCDYHSLHQYRLAELRYNFMMLLISISGLKVYLLNQIGYP